MMKTTEHGKNEMKTELNEAGGEIVSHWDKKENESPT